MNGTAQQLYTSLQGFAQSDEAGRSPQEQLVDYCVQVLGSVERLYFDFKCKQNPSRPELSESDKRNLAKAVSSFANSAGGVVIWGIDDGSLTPKPISQVARFAQRLQELVAHVAMPLVPGIDTVMIPAQADPTAGYAVTYIPESTLPPHQVILNLSDVQHRYYVRTGSSFVPASHVQLEDMFGRRPRPVLSLSTRIAKRSSSGDKVRVLVFVGITNQGRGSAAAPFLSLIVHPPYQLWGYGIDGNRRFGLEELVRPSGQRERRFGADAGRMIHPGMTLDVAAVEVELPQRRTLDSVEPLIMDYAVAAQAVPLKEGQVVLTAQSLFEKAVSS